MHRILVALCGGLVACGEMDVTQPETVSPADDTIIGGTPSELNEYPAVGSLLFTGDDGAGGPVAGMLCTGTLIAPDTVLLAAHCVDPQLLAWFGESAQLYFSFTLDVSRFGADTFDLPAETTPVVASVMHPQFDINAFNTDSPGLGDYKDVALAFLSREVSRTPAMVMGPNDTVDKINASVEIVGYGQRTPEQFSSEYGIKYEAESVINEIGTFEMQIGNRAPTPQKCHGDSGGPTFLVYDDGMQPAERLIGVTSHAYDASDCDKGGVDTRVDVHREFIETSMIDACTQNIRTACVGGGGLAVPSLGAALAGGPGRPLHPAPRGCNSAGAPVPVLMAGLIVWTLALRRRRSSTH